MQRLETLNNQIQAPQQYRYVHSTNFLSKEQAEFYEKNGYVIVKNVVGQQEIQKYITRFLEYCDNKVERYPGLAVVRDISLVKKNKNIKGEQAIIKLQDWFDDEILFEYCKNEQVLNYVSDIIGPNIKASHTMIINKPPNVGKTQRHPIHQDLAYFPFRPADKIVCCWTAMEKVNRENGGLVVYPGTHKTMEFVSHESPNWKEGVNRGYWGISEKYLPEGDAHRVYPEMEMGDCILFHPLLLHGSGINRTQRYRKSISCHFSSCECQYVNIKGTPNEGIAQEICDWTKQHFKLNLNYEAIWRAKTRLVRGEEFDGDKYI